LASNVLNLTRKSYEARDIGSRRFCRQQSIEFDGYFFARMALSSGFGFDIHEKMMLYIAGFVIALRRSCLTTQSDPNSSL
jgi:hypothetical protein